MTSNLLEINPDAAYHKPLIVDTPSQWFASVGPIIGSAGRGLLVTDNCGNICQVNERLSEIVGYAPDELNGNNPRMLQSGNTAAATYLQLWNSVSSGRSWRGILQNRRKSGAKFIEDITITPIVDSRGAITHYFGLVEEVGAAPPKPPIQSNCEQLDQAHTVSSGIAHEINNVLTGIIGHCSFLGRAPHEPAASRRRVDTIQSLAYRLSAFSDKLSVCAGPQLHRPERIELNKIVVEALDELEGQLNIDSAMCYLAEEPIYVAGSRELVNIALVEMARNALEAAHSSATDLDVTVRKIQWEGTSISEGLLSLDFGLPIGKAACVEIKDKACGMEWALLQRATELFFSTKPAHAGLGLCAVVGIAKSHRGAFELRSDAGHGTSAKLILPLVP